MHEAVSEAQRSELAGVPSVLQERAPQALQAGWWAGSGGGGIPARSEGDKE